MFKMFKKLHKRIKNFKKVVELSKKRPEVLELDIDNLPDDNDFFFSDGTHEEFEQFDKEQKGISKWYKRLENL